MTVHRFTIDDQPNPWIVAVEVDADTPDQARTRAAAWMFARRSTGDPDGLVHLTLETGS